MLSVPESKFYLFFSVYFFNKFFKFYVFDSSMPFGYHTNFLIKFLVLLKVKSFVPLYHLFRCWSFIWVSLPFDSRRVSQFFLWIFVRVAKLLRLCHKLPLICPQFLENCHMLTTELMRFFVFFFCWFLLSIYFVWSFWLSFIPSVQTMLKISTDDQIYLFIHTWSKFFTLWIAKALFQTWFFPQSTISLNS